MPKGFLSLADHPYYKSAKGVGEVRKLTIFAAVPTVVTILKLINQAHITLNDVYKVVL